jgi:transcriptional regulator with XRE-family HTH domain
MGLTVKKTRIAEERHRALRQEGGDWLRQLRSRAELSQREMADLLGLQYYTFISQLENGVGRIPSGRYVDWARVLGVPVEPGGTLCS